MMAPRKANTPTLTREQIVSAAIGIVDREGLKALSMRKLAAELGVGAMSLYYHVPDKSALYDLILDAIMGEFDPGGDDASAPVDERLARIARSLRRALLAHPHAAIISMSRSLRTPTQLRPVEAMLAILDDAGVPVVEAMRAVNVIGQYVVGVTTAYANHLADTEYHHDDHEQDFTGITPEEFPHVVGAFEYAEHFGSWDSDFETGLSALLKGLVLDCIP